MGKLLVNEKLDSSQKLYFGDSILALALLHVKIVISLSFAITDPKASSGRPPLVCVAVRHAFICAKSAVHLFFFFHSHLLEEAKCLENAVVPALPRRLSIMHLLPHQPISLTRQISLQTGDEHMFTHSRPVKLPSYTFLTTSAYSATSRPWWTGSNRDTGTQRHRDTETIMSQSLPIGCTREQSLRQRACRHFCQPPLLPEISY